MKTYVLILIGLLFTFNLTAQSIQLTDHLVYPRLDSLNWFNDIAVLTGNNPAKANKYQVCTFTETDSTRGRFCFNTTFGHVQLDTTLQAITSEKLSGEWQVVALGTFEVKDSMTANGPVCDRQTTILNENKSPTGSMKFIDNKIQIDFRNLDDMPSGKGSYAIIDGKYLAAKAFLKKSTSTAIGLTNDGFLILDDHTYSTLAKKDTYLAIRTTIRRIILKKV
jgi:hypothetical protein